MWCLISHSNIYATTNKKVIKEAKRQHYSSLTAESNNKVKTTWSVITRETGKVHSTEQVHSILMNGEKIKGSKNVANAFINFFLTIAWILNIHQGKTILFLKCWFPGNAHSIKVIPITEAEIKCIIHSFDQKKLCGYEEVRSKILKACTSHISHQSSYICNVSLYAIFKML